jgi:hypothetical protein
MIALHGCRFELLKALNRSLVLYEHVTCILTGPDYRVNLFLFLNTYGTHGLYISAGEASTASGDVYSIY